MAKNLLVGVGSKARKVKALYVGVGGKARKVKKVYVGVGGKARLVYTSSIPVTGISVSYERAYNGAANTVAIYVTILPSNATTQTYTVTIVNDNNGIKYTLYKYLSNGFVILSPNVYGNETYGCTVTIAAADGIKKVLRCQFYLLNGGWTITEQ